VILFLRSTIDIGLSYSEVETSRFLQLLSGN